MEKIFLEIIEKISEPEYLPQLQRYVVKDADEARKKYDKLKARGDLPRSYIAQIHHHYLDKPCVIETIEEV